MVRIRGPLESVARLSREQWLQVGLMSTFFMLLMATFWLLKPVRTSLLLTTLGAREAPVLGLLAVVLLGLVVGGFSRLVDLVGRCQMVCIVLSMFAAAFVAAWGLLSYAPVHVAAARPTVYAIYLLVDVFATVMLVVFWTYVNDTVDRREADRMYGPIGLGGIVGGILGSVVTEAAARPLGPTNLLVLCAALMGATMMLVMVSDRLLGRRGEVCTAGTGTGKGGFAAAAEGAQLVRRSSYLLLIVVVLASYEVVSTTNGFVIYEVIDRAYDDPATISEVYGRLGWVVNGTALLVQLLVVPSLLPNKMLALTVMPVALLVTSAGFLAVPSVAMAFPLMASDNGLNYSLQQTAKETLYVPLGKLEKFKAKAFIDMFAFRVAKGLAAVGFLVVTWWAGEGLRWPVIVNLGVLAVWCTAALQLASKYRRRYGTGASLPAPSTAG